VTFNEGKYTLKTPWENADFWVYGPWDVPASGVPSDCPQPSYSSILRTDSIADWLNREVPAYTWFDDGTFGPYVYTLSNVDSQFIFVFKVSNGEWPILLRQLFPKFNLDPGWPGLADVLIGTPVALDVGFTVAGPMNGVLIDITGVPTKQGFFEFDTVRSWRNVGAIAFQTDNGDEELPQTLGFVNAVYCPRTFVQASAVVGRCSAGVTGTCTPWTRRSS
jgi:hypothetical protein